MDVPAAWIESELGELLEDHHSVGVPAPVAIRVALATLIGGEEIVTMGCHGRYHDGESFWECLAFTRSRIIQVTARRTGEHWSYYSDTSRDVDANHQPPEVTGTSRFLRDVRQVRLVSPRLTRRWPRFSDEPTWGWTTGVEIDFGSDDVVVSPLSSGSPTDPVDDEHVTQVLALLASDRA